MKKRLYIGNIPFSAIEDDIRDFFKGYELSDVIIVTDRETGQARGFGFVELDSEDAGVAARNLNGQIMGGRTIVINEARERQPRSNGGGAPVSFTRNSKPSNVNGNKWMRSRDDDDFQW